MLIKISSYFDTMAILLPARHGKACKLYTAYFRFGNIPFTANVTRLFFTELFLETRPENQNLRDPPA
jgi:hypothetical protein